MKKLELQVKKTTSLIGICLRINKGSIYIYIYIYIYSVHYTTKYKSNINFKISENNKIYRI